MDTATRRPTTVVDVMIEAAENPPHGADFDLVPTLMTNPHGGYDSDNGHARITADDGTITVYRFELPGKLVVWQAVFSAHTPSNVVAAAWEAARA